LKNQFPVKLTDDSPVDDGLQLPASLPEIRIDADLHDFSAAFLAEMSREKKHFCISIDMPMPQSLSSGDKYAYLVVCLAPDQIFAYSTDYHSKILEFLVGQGVGSHIQELLPVGHSIKSRFRGLPYVLPFGSCFDVEVAGYILNQIEGGSPSFEMLYEHAVRESYPRFAVYEGPDNSLKNASENPMELLLAQTSLQIRTMSCRGLPGIVHTACNYWKNLPGGHFFAGELLLIRSRRLQKSPWKNWCMI